MSTLNEKANFLAKLNGVAVKAEADARKRNKRAQIAQELLGDGLAGPVRDDLRAAATFTVKLKGGKGEVQSMDERGARHSVETEDAPDHYEAMDPATEKRVREGLEKIMALKAKMLAKDENDPDTPLFTEAELAEELFSPLAREGLMPQALVEDRYSEISTTLKQSMKSFTQMLATAQEEQRLARSKNEAHFHGSGTASEQLAAAGGKLKDIAAANLGPIAKKCGFTQEELKRAALIGKGTVMLGYNVYLAEVSGQKAHDEITGQSKAPSNKVGMQLTKDSGKVLQSGIQSGVELGDVGSKHQEALDGDSESIRQSELRSAAAAAAMGIDMAINDELLAVDPMLAQAASNRFGLSIDAAKLIGAADGSRPQAETLIGLVCDGLVKGLDGLAPSAAEALAEAGRTLKSAYEKQVDRKALLAALDFKASPVAQAFDALVAAAGPAAKEAFQSPALALAAQNAKSELTAKAEQGNAELTDQLEEGNRQMEEFERQLVLVDEGGEDLARQRSIGVLIAQLEKDRLDLEIVKKVGSVLSGFGGGVALLGRHASNTAMGKPMEQAVGGAQTVATEVTQSLIPALKAAQLVMQMSVTIVQIARRYELASAFKGDIVKARKAGSALLPAVENFYSAKVYQQTYAALELALQTVQLAGSICASVPEPITMAVGRALSAASVAAAAAVDLAHQITDEKKLREGWKVTLDALNNPKNRRLGLDALHANGTLAIHAVAWAAMDGDPIAAEILRSCGVEAQTLADSGTDQNAVIAYLETRLHEDLQFKDGEKIKFDWVPEPLVLSYAYWFTVCNRARTKATPKLSTLKAPNLDAAFKKVDLQPSPADLEKALLGQGIQQVPQWTREVRELCDALDKHAPTLPDGTPHQAMAEVCKRLKALADARLRDLSDVATAT